MERARAEDRAVAHDGNGNHQELAVPGAALSLARCGYVLVAAPMMASCAGLADTPVAAFFAYALLLLGVAFVSLAILQPRPVVRRLEEENRAVWNGNDQGDEVVVVPDAGTIAWCGYVLVAAPVTATCAGLADTPVAALFAYALLLLGVAFTSLAMLLPPPTERMLEEENSAVGNGNHQANGLVLPDARTIAWCGYLFVATQVLASWAGLADGPAATFVVYALLLLGVAFIVFSMLAPAKPKTA